MNHVKNLICRSHIRTLFVLSVLCFAFLGFVPSSAHAAFLQFDPATSSINVDATTSIKVNLDAGTQQVAGTDIYVNFDNTYVSLQSVTGGDFFPIVSNTPQTSRVYVSGVIANPGEYKTGTGLVATLVFKAIKAGSTTITFDCDFAKTQTSKINQNDINASNVIDCSKLNSHTITIGSGSGTGTTPTPSTLPQSGFLEDMLLYSSIGAVLVAFGFGIKFFAKI